MDAARIAQLTRNFNPEQRHKLLTMMQESETVGAAVDRYSHPAELMVACDPSYRISPAIELISREIEKTLDTPGRNLLITAPPQEGKSLLTCVGTPARALQKRPDCRAILAMYSDALAAEHGSRCRDLFLNHGSDAIDPLTGQPMPDRLGLSLDPSYGSASRWRIKGHDGGLVSAGIGSGITGRPADLFIVDDPYKVRGEADSETYRRKIESFFESVVYLRLGPGANIIMILTRWHDEDIAGKILAQEKELREDLRTWKHINIPAIATAGVPDALGRADGEYLISARGRTPEEFDMKRRQVGERTFWAMYQGVPRPPAGGLFAQQWLDDSTLDTDPVSLGGVVAIDPAETGERDEAGIVAATRSGDVTVITHDWSGQMTSEKWARKAALLAVKTSARTIHIEGYTAHVTYTAIVRTALSKLAEEARSAADYTVDGVDCTALVRGVRPVVKAWRGKGDAVVRSAGLRFAIEAGTCRLSPGLDKLVEEAAGWQQGQHCPDRVAAAVIAYEAVTPRSGRSTQLARPTDAERTAASARRGGAWGRSIG